MKPGVLYCRACDEPARTCGCWTAELERVGQLEEAMRKVQRRMRRTRICILTLAVIAGAANAAYDTWLNGFAFAFFLHTIWNERDLLGIPKRRTQ